MKTEDIHLAEQGNKPAVDGNNIYELNGHKYKILGESGLVEDEDGDVYSVSEIFPSEKFALPKSLRQTICKKRYSPLYKHNIGLP